MSILFKKKYGFLLKNLLKIDRVKLLFKNWKINYNFLNTKKYNFKVFIFLKKKSRNL